MYKEVLSSIPYLNLFTSYIYTILKIIIQVQYFNKIYREKKLFKSLERKIKVEPVIPHEACHRTKAFSPKINNNDILFIFFSLFEFKPLYNA